MQPAGFNKIYATLVEDENDILGIIAYSLYKQQKIEFIQNTIQQHGRDPTADELKIFHDLSNYDSSIASYQLKAEQLAREFLDAALGSKIDEIRADNDARLVEKVESFKPSLTRGVAENILASIISLAVIGLIVFLSWSARVGIKEAFEEAFDVDISSQRDANPRP